MHIACILDGNRRWAKEKGLPKFMGHQRGFERAKEMISYMPKHGVSMLTLYALSTENMSRDAEELSYLFKLLEKWANDEKLFSKNNVRVFWLGKPDELPESTVAALEKMVKRTSGNTGLTLQLAINYGGRDEIVRAVQKIEGEITEESLTAALDTEGRPNPDLLIRTGGNQRISNFLIWQMAYTDFYFCEKKLPDFDEDEFVRILEWWRPEERRFGK